MTRATRWQPPRHVDQPETVSAVDVMNVRGHPSAARFKDFAVRTFGEVFLLEN